MLKAQLPDAVTEMNPSEAPQYQNVIRETIEYYDARSEYYDERDFTERIDDLRLLRSTCRDLCSGLNVLEVACGTGGWTSFVAKYASFVHAVDISDSMLQVAESRCRKLSNVQLTKADAYNLSTVSGSFTAGLAAWWISHIPKDLLSSFFEGIHRKLAPGSVVVLMDDTVAVGDAISKYDESGNTFTRRYLRDGRCYEIIKNFISYEDLAQVLGPYTTAIDFDSFQYHWIASYTT